MKRPSFQFYPADFESNSNLKRCSWAARGAWIYTLCLLHDSDDYGMLRWSLSDIAQAVGCDISLMRELVEKGVLKGSDSKKEKVSFSVSISKKNAPSEVVSVLNDVEGPIWFSSRMLRDEYIRQKRASHGFKSENNENVPRKKVKNMDIEKDTFSPSPSSSSSSSSSDIKENINFVNAKESSGRRTAARGTRLPSDWVMSDEYYQEARRVRPEFTEDDVQMQADIFKDHWIAKTGTSATKIDWLATWRNWIRSAKQQRPKAWSAKNEQLNNIAIDELDRQLFGLSSIAH